MAVLNSTFDVNNFILYQNHSVRVFPIFNYLHLCINPQIAMNRDWCIWWRHHWSSYGRIKCPVVQSESFQSVTFPKNTSWESKMCQLITECDWLTGSCVITLPPNRIMCNHPILTLPPNRIMCNHPILTLPPNRIMCNHPILTLPPNRIMCNHPILTLPPNRVMCNHPILTLPQTGSCVITPSWHYLQTGSCVITPSWHYLQTESCVITHPDITPKQDHV